MPTINPNLLPTLTRAFCTVLIISFLGFAGAKFCSGDDWPGMQGPERNNRSKETGLLDSWPENGPELVWSFKTAGVGYSSPAVVGNRIYLTGGRGGRAELFCLDANDGTELWSLPLNEKNFDFKGNSWGAGPRTTPTVSGDLVYGLSGDGQLVCASTDGELKWQLSMLDDLGGAIDPIGGGPETFGWGYCWAPLVDGENLICTPGSLTDGGLVVALNAKSGEVVWRSTELSEQATYASPVVATIHGIRQYVVMTQSGVASVAADSGKSLWYYQRSRPYSDVVIPTPVCHENYVYASTGDGCDLIQIVASSSGELNAEKVYSSRNMKNSIGGFVYHEGYIFGTSERRGWICQDFMTGDIAWYERANRGVGDGSIIFADDHLYLFGEKTAQVSLIKASSEKWVEKGNFALPESSTLTAPSGKTWTRPVIANGKLYLRDQDLLFCYAIQ